MTDEQKPTALESIPVSDEVRGLVRKAMDQVFSGKTTLADVFGSVAGVGFAKVERKPLPPVPAITDDQLEALKMLPSLYGQVVPSSPRKLTQPELRALVTERNLIDKILGFVEKRKSESIRETLANHFDATVPKSDEGHPTDAKGHYAVKQEEPVPGTGLKAQRIVSGGKPSLTIAMLEKALADGVIDRKTYLACTRKPDSPRILDEHAMSQAIKKNPPLLFLLASVAKPTSPTTTIKVVPDN